MKAAIQGASTDRIVLGLSANRSQFALLVLVNAFVGGMVGLERSVLPLIAEREFGIASRSAVLSFIVSFGITKAITNLAAGRFADRLGRRRLLIAGWIVGLPVPVLVMVAPSWAWVTAANILLGINQGLCWSTTVLMKIDLVGRERRGLAMGLNECAGYLAVAAAAYAAGVVASEHGLRPMPFMMGIGFAVVGLTLSVLFVRDTADHVREEHRQHGPAPAAERSIRDVFARVSWGDRNLSACSQAGLVNNLNDGIAWGLFPLLFAEVDLSVRRIGVLAALYPAVWGTAQLVTGALSDRWGRKWLIASGMWAQAVAIVVIAGAPLVFGGSHSFGWWIGGAVLLGLGTALVYPTLLAAIGDAAEPAWRAPALGVYRFWRDLGYAVGAVLAGLLADLFDLHAAVFAVGGITFVSGVIVAARMRGALTKERQT